MNHVAFVFALGLVGSACAQTDSPTTIHAATQDASEFIQLNLHEGKIGPINRNDNIEDIIDTVGSENVFRETIVIKGDNQIQYQIIIDDEFIYLTNRTFRIESPRFRTEDNHGVGSTIGAFEAAFGSGVLGEADLSEPIDYYDDRGIYLFSIVVDASCITFQNGQVRFDLSCSVREIWL